MAQIVLTQNVDFTNTLAKIVLHETRALHACLSLSLFLLVYGSQRIILSPCAMSIFALGSLQ